ncbi:MAG: FKBP-type peptidyl-prolyl cis-trans isomerase N-terminal domain-containing protein [Prevotella sp.]|nr:FKBP-type peptidyl-prolyl cis-trans isomerase N-terminal domain-containing protein [Bacteroides sp.]MCM1366497.1 FKBP-type peptidyl-prolyl cis-trans isomerase N-terminal domain-containing protein [Prevotella sp.]MCM1436836.1 FKBP-type peptidyl-prolyl cis-trans isomerase N-terminal domain-containing protein [Prevotella sp.]
MKFKALIILLASTSVMFASCSGAGEGHDLSEVKNATEADSISNLLGQMYAVDYWRSSVGDSVAMSEEARNEYLKGVEAALKMSGKDENYIKGYILGLQLSQFTGQYKTETGIEINNKLMLSGLAYGLRNDSIVNYEKVNQDLSVLTTRIATRRQEQVKAEGEKKLAEYAKAHNYKQFKPDLYGTITKPGEGAALSQGDMIEVQIRATDVDGKPIRLPLPTEVTVTPEMDNAPIGSSLLQLRPGGSGEFVTTAEAAFGAHSSRFRVDPGQLVILHATIKKFLGKSDGKSVTAGDMEGEEIKPVEAK